MVTRQHARRPVLATAALLSASALLLAGCASGPSGGDSTGDAGNKTDELSVLITAENIAGKTTLETLAGGVCKAENDELPLTIETSPSAQMQQKILLLAGQDALPVWFAAGQQFIAGEGQLAKAGQVLDVGKTLDDLGVADQVTPLARSVIEQLYGGEFPTMPLQLNTEGIFYNKQMFADNGIEVPETLDDLISAAEKLKAAGITPFVASGKTGYTISRWIGQLLFRSLGADAMQKIQSGDAKLTDPEYVEAAQQLQDMGKAGLFIDGITNLDNDTAMNQILTGKAAMMYNLTTFLQQVNNPDLNQVGDDIAFMPFPAITGGKGSIEDLPANVGSPNVLSQKLYGPNVGEWMKCIAENVGSVSLKEQGTFSGFTVNEPVDDLPPLTADIQKRIEEAPSSVLWFEALFNQKATTDASNNAAPLLTGAMTAEQYMSILQADLDEG